MRGSAKCNLGFHAVQASNERFKGQMPFKDTKKLQDASTAQRRNPKSPRNAAAHAPPFPGCWHLHGRGNTTARISAHSPFSPLEPRKTRRACDACREPRAWKWPRVARQLPGRVPCISGGVGWCVVGDVVTASALTLMRLANLRLDEVSFFGDQALHFYVHRIIYV